MDNSWKLTVSPDWEELESVRTKAGKFLLQYDLDDDEISSAVMVLSELLENSIKYGSFTEPDDEIEVNLGLSQSNIVVEVSNPADDSCLPNLNKLDRMIQWVRGYQDPFEAYVERLKVVAQKSLKDKKSGLGIVRVAYEGDVTLDFHISEEGRLTVSAVREI